MHQAEISLSEVATSAKGGIVLCGGRGLQNGVILVIEVLGG